MKRVFFVCLAIALLLSMTACAGSAPKESPASHTGTSTEASTQEMTTASPTQQENKGTTNGTTKTPTTAPTTGATKTPTTVATAVATKAPTVTATKCSHSNTEWVIDNEATCIGKGDKHEVCTDCKTVLRSADIEKTQHNYTNYKCTVCGEFQEGGISKYLSDWVQRNGEVHGDTVSLDFYIDDVLYGFTYNASGNYFYFSLLDENYNDFLSMYFTETAGVYDLAYIQGTEPNTREVYGKINAAEFTENTPVTVEEYLGNSDQRPGAVENCRICTCLLLESIETALEKYNVGLTLEDLGFTNFK